MSKIIIILGIKNVKGLKLNCTFHFILNKHFFEELFGENLKQRTIALVI
jgi:hypothetical protein